MFPPLPIFSLGNYEYAHDNTEKILKMLYLQSYEPSENKVSDNLLRAL